MLTNIDIDQKKVAEVMSLLNIKTKKEAVDKALENYLRILSAQELLKMKGSNVWEGDLDKMRTE
ncbi:type II toxin-antitoxin system VapB family antitoxin [Lacihabitans soyangensis]|uniref:Type II toxin-antitoxin system VapB family antitoxin n=1 Tax=Lacihabitans soyangensis TaxID=869394 RepID=A0AAE3KVC7_9BACT|nr:type II toxin-antitoxin system VapB family antitoxin [Lacihabitans soyangensis]MCP9765998.1 type II toxin-antitoxin system VapB family antitoxin [Lacihabitans soyangensis]